MVRPSIQSALGSDNSSIKAYSGVEEVSIEAALKSTEPDLEDIDLTMNNFQREPQQRPSRRRRYIVGSTSIQSGVGKTAEKNKKVLRAAGGAISVSELSDKNSQHLPSLRQRNI